MSTYIIGDIQGCYRELQELLKCIEFNPKQDRLGFVGDLVNRGPDSLAVLEFIRALPDPLLVLGNHDLYLLILGYGLIDRHLYPHTLHDVLRAPNRADILKWLRKQPLMRRIPDTNAVLVHAGIPPQWSIAEALDHSEEIHQVLQSKRAIPFLSHLFGNDPVQWSNHLSKQNRWRYITNAFTRMRYCDSEGCLDLKNKLHTHDTLPQDFLPWYQWRDPKVDDVDIIFGHWAALDGQCEAEHGYALDTGCGWGRRLTALCLETKQRISVECRSLAKDN